MGDKRGGRQVRRWQRPVGTGQRGAMGRHRDGHPSSEWEADRQNCWYEVSLGRNGRDHSFQAAERQKGGRWSTEWRQREKWTMSPVVNEADQKEWAGLV